MKWFNLPILWNFKPSVLYMLFSLPINEYKQKCCANKMKFSYIQKHLVSVFYYFTFSSTNFWIISPKHSQIITNTWIEVCEVLLCITSVLQTTHLICKSRRITKNPNKSKVTHVSLLLNIFSYSLKLVQQLLFFKIHGKGYVGHTSSLEVL